MGLVHDPRWLSACQPRSFAGLAGAEAPFLLGPVAALEPSARFCADGFSAIRSGAEPRALRRTARWRRPRRRRLEPDLDQGVALHMDDDANQAAGIAVLGARDAASAGARVRNGLRITDSTPRPSPQAGARANRGSSALAPPPGTKSTAAPGPGWPRTRGGGDHFRRSIARLVPQPGQNTSSQGVSAISAARIVGDHNMSRLAAS
jgi:hypothetical protein